MLYCVTFNTVLYCACNIEATNTVTHVTLRFIIPLLTLRYIINTTDGHDLAQPYTSDLEYLEDSFQLIETLGKALKIEDDDDSFLLRADQRKPEAVIRELKAKSRSLNAKIKQKLEATQNLEGIYTL